jgi:hypothetical protein
MYRSAALATLALLPMALSACATSQPQPQRIVVQTAPAVAPVVVPGPPPPPMGELVPPPPQATTPVAWQPGHWRYSGALGNPWTWQPGQYVSVPTGQSAWTPGQWVQTAAGWTWVEGHWS